MLSSLSYRPAFATISTYNLGGGSSCFSVRLERRFACPHASILGLPRALSASGYWDRGLLAQRRQSGSIELRTATWEMPTHTAWSNEDKTRNAQSLSARKREILRAKGKRRPSRGTKTHHPLQHLLASKLALISICATGGFANAAEIDRASRSDVSDFRSAIAAPSLRTSPDKSIRPGNQYLDYKLQRNPPLGGLPPPQPTEIPPASSKNDLPTFTATLGASQAYATNAGQTATDPIEALYVTPEVALEYIRPKAIGSWKLDATLTAARDFYSTHPNDLDETRLNAAAIASTPTSLGVVFLQYEGKMSFDRDLSQRNYTQERYKFGIQPAFGKPLSLKITAEYRASDAPGQRRRLLSVNLGHEFPGEGARPTFQWSELVQFSDFRAGSNAHRSDAFTQSKLDMTWKLKSGYDVGISMSLFKNFSNRARNRFSDFEIGPTISKSF